MKATSSTIYSLRGKEIRKTKIQNISPVMKSRKKISAKREDFSLVPETAPIYAEDIVLPPDADITETELLTEDKYEDLDLPYVALHRMYNSLCEQCETELDRYQSLDRKRARLMKNIDKLRENIAKLSADDSNNN